MHHLGQVETAGLVFPARRPKALRRAQALAPGRQRQGAQFLIESAMDKARNVIEGAETLHLSMAGADAARYPLKPVSRLPVPCGE